MKNLKVDFHIIKDDTDLKQAIKRCWDLGSEQARNYSFSDGMVRLRAHSIENGLVCGDMMRIRLDEPAMVAKVGGGERSIARDDDEGLGETNAFLYCPEKKCLAYQRNRGGVSVDRFFYYLQQKINRQNAIDYEPVLKPTTVNDLVNASRTRKLVLAVRPASITPSAQEDPLSDVVRAANLIECQQFEIAFKMQRGTQGGLNKSAVVQVIKKLLSLRRDGHDIGKLEAVCQDGNGKSEILDFVDALLYSVQKIEPSKLHNEFYDRRKACVHNAWDECSGQIVIP